MLAVAVKTFEDAIQIGSYSPDDSWDPPKPKQEKPSADKFAHVKGHWAEESIKFVVAEGLFNGIGETSFSPDTDMDRAMLATVLARMAKADLSRYTKQICRRSR